MIVNEFYMSIMAALPAKIYKRNMFIDIFLNQGLFGVASFTYVVGDPSFENNSNFLTTEIILPDNKIDKYKNKINDFHLYNETLLKNAQYLDNSQEFEQMNEIMSRCFCFKQHEHITFEISSRAYTLEIKLCNTYFALFRRNEQLRYETQNKNIFIENQHCIGKYQKEYPFANTDDFIFNDTVDYINKNEKSLPK